MTRLQSVVAAARTDLADRQARGEQEQAARAAALRSACDSLVAIGLPPEAAGPLHEALLDPGRRRASGAHYTPPELADVLVGIALDAVAEPPAVILDPACGGGAMLLAAARYLQRRWGICGAAAADRLAGADLDPVAVELCGWAVSQVCGAPPRLRVADSLLATPGEWDRWLAVGQRLVVTNPPFLGGSAISGALGRAYRERLVAELAGGRRGTADLCAYWLLAVQRLLRPGERAGLVCTNTITEGTTRRVGLELAEQRGVRLESSLLNLRWPGPATLHCSLLWLRQGQPEAGPTAIPPPAAARGRAFNGAKIYGQGFLLPRAEAAALIAAEPRRAEVLKPYLSGSDLYSRAEVQPSRYVIDFGDWPLERAASEHPELLARVEALVKPERQRLAGRNAIGDRRAREWWLFGSRTPSLDAALAGRRECLVRVLHSATHQFVRVPTGWVFSHALAVFPEAGPEWLALWQSTWHELWSLAHGSTLGAAPRHTVSTTAATFPLPVRWDGLAAAGAAYDDARATALAASGHGLTALWHRLHDPDEASPELLAWRAAGRHLDDAVTAAYGLPQTPQHGWHKVGGHWRYGYSEADRHRVIEWLSRAAAGSR